MKFLPALIVSAFIVTSSLVACGDDSSSVFPDAVGDLPSSSAKPDDAPASSGDNSSGSSVKSSTGGKSSAKSSSSVKSSSSMDSKSSVSSSSSSTGSSSSLRACSEEDSIIEQRNRETGKKEWFVCENGFYVLFIMSSASEGSSSSYFNMDSLYNSKKSYGEFVDPRDGQKYRTITIEFGYDGVDSITLFATNLNYGKQIKLATTEFDDNVTEKYCYDDDPWYCDNGFGGLYSWSEAFGLPKACDSVWTGTTPACPDSIFPGREYDHEWDRLKIQGICPEGWHVMNRQEWGALKGASEDDYGFVSKVSGGSNSQGFSALYGGGVSPTEQKSLYIRKSGFYQLPYERDAEVNNSVILDRILLRFDQPAQKTDALSVRCVKNR